MHQKVTKIYTWNNDLQLNGWHERNIDAWNAHKIKHREKTPNPKIWSWPKITDSAYRHTDINVEKNRIADSL